MNAKLLNQKNKKDKPLINLKRTKYILKIKQIIYLFTTSFREQTY